MKPRSPHRPRRLLHSLVLFGVLCVLGVQTLEAQHTHAPDEQFSECLLCQASTAAAAASAAQPPIAPGVSARTTAALATIFAQRVHSPRTARGPPAIS